MDGGDLKTLNRWHGGDLKTLSRQHGGIFGLLGKLLGLGPGELSDKQHGSPSLTYWASCAFECIFLVCSDFSGAARHRRLRRACDVPLSGEEGSILEAQWPIGYGVELRIKRSSVRIRPWPLR